MSSPNVSLCHFTWYFQWKALMGAGTNLILRVFTVIAVELYLLKSFKLLQPFEFSRLKLTLYVLSCKMKILILFLNISTKTFSLISELRTWYVQLRKKKWERHFLALLLEVWELFYQTMKHWKRKFLFQCNCQLHPHRFQDEAFVFAKVLLTISILWGKVDEPCAAKL